MSDLWIDYQDDEPMALVRKRKASRSDVLKWLGDLRIHYGPDDDWYDIKWCRKHDDVAKVYSDGSIGCWWEGVVEASEHHQDSDIVTVGDVLAEWKRAAWERAT